MRILVTCPPMLGMIESFTDDCARVGFELVCPEVIQTLSEESLLTLVPTVDGWIVGDDPATRRVLEGGRRGRLRAVVKWGIGTDNVDQNAIRELELPFANTPGMFGKEVADLAMSYVTALARHTFEIDRRIRLGEWPKPKGISLSGRTVGIVGMGDIGSNLARRALAAEMRVIAYDPNPARPIPEKEIEHATWPTEIHRCDFIVLCCRLTSSNHHMINDEILSCVRPGLRLVNVARGSLVDQDALIRALKDGHVGSAALDVFENEPLPVNAPLRQFDQCIFGSHNASNTIDAVTRASIEAISILTRMLATHEHKV